jgi:pimeloyl-ACP methyl ester carboxylesterase
VRALEPTETGHLDTRGFRIGYEVFGEATGRPLLFLPTWQIVHMRMWKMQIPYFARHGFRVIAHDLPGNGLAERTTDSRAFEQDRVADQSVDLLDRLGVAQADLVGLSASCPRAVNIAARYPDRARRLVLIGSGIDPAVQRTPEENAEIHRKFWTAHPTYDGWQKRNAHYWLEHWDEWLEFFFGNAFSEPHSTKGIEDAVAWGHDTTPEIIVRTQGDPKLAPSIPVAEQLRRVRCPVLMIHGSDDRITPLAGAQHVIDMRPDFELIVLEGVGHIPQARHPVKVNLEIERFLQAPATPRWRRAQTRLKKALFVSSPIGLGHALRDAAIADELRALVPGLEIDWLSQSPVTNVLEARGERVHPLSKHLAGESKHIESEMSGEHDLRVFQAFRKMDEILLANFMVFHDAVKDGEYDLWVGDEAWDVDHFLHENPELRTSPFAWLTDFVGWLPMPPDADGREACLTADYNAEMIEHVERFKRVRDAAIFVGNPDDIVPDRFGPELPAIREWTEAHYDFSGYVRYFDPSTLDRAALREKFGFAPDECVALATVGGTSVGASLLKRVIASYPQAKDLIPNLRMIVVAGPRIDPDSLPRHEGIEYRAYVHQLYEMLAAIDVALVQGGLSTTMELVGAKRPFLYFPLQGHFEQNRHVPHRLANYGVPAEARVDYASASPEEIARRLARTVRDRPAYREIEGGGARRAAERLAALL